VHSATAGLSRQQFQESMAAGLPARAGLLALLLPESLLALEDKTMSPFWPPSAGEAARTAFLARIAAEHSCLCRAA